jgi:hypothetical protein
MILISEFAVSNMLNSTPAGPARCHISSICKRALSNSLARNITLWTKMQEAKFKLREIKVRIKTGNESRLWMCRLRDAGFCTSGKFGPV